MRSIALASILLLLPSLAWAATAAPADADPDPYAQNACVQCHGDLPGRSSEIVALEWGQSVHHDAGVGCDGCHGGDPSLRREQFDSVEAFKHAAHLQRNPEFLLMHRPDREFVSTARGRSVSYFCGKCHAEIKEKHLGSPHGDFGDPTCLYCHGQGSHLIKEATPQIIDTASRTDGGRCSTCHAANTMEAVSRIKSILVETETRIEASSMLYTQLEAWGYHNLELEQLFHHADEVNSKLRRIFHSFNMREINSFAGEIEDIADRTEAAHELIGGLRQAQRRQAIIGLGAVFLLLSLASLMVYYKHAFLDHPPGYHPHHPPHRLGN